MSIDIEKLELLTAARKKTWQALHEAIGAEAAASEFLNRCKAAVRTACAADEKAGSDLYDFVYRQAVKPDSPSGGEGA